MSEYFPSTEELEPKDPLMEQLEAILVQLEDEGEVDIEVYSELCALIAETHGMTPDQVQQMIATIRKEIA